MVSSNRSYAYSFSYIQLTTSTCQNNIFSKLSSSTTGNNTYNPATLLGKNSGLGVGKAQLANFWGPSPLGPIAVYAYEFD